jgi:hypothetical protein
MNDWQMEKMAESRRKAIRHEMEQINLQHLAQPAGSKPLLFRLGSGLVALGERLRKQHKVHERDYWAVQNELKSEHR